MIHDRARHATFPFPGAAPRPASGRGSRLLDLQRLAGNRAVAAAVQRQPRDPRATDPKAADPKASAGADPSGPRRVTGYVGMNPDAAKETKALKAATLDEVLVAVGDPALEQQLRDEPGITAYIFDEVGIGPDDLAARRLAIEALRQCAPAARDTLAGLMRWLYRAEKGEIVLDRLVLSGHSNGFEFWGDSAYLGAPNKPGMLILERDLANVAAAFPGGAAQVRAIMFSACETTGTVEIVARVFPNLESCWAYGGFSPSIKQGSAGDIAAWAKATGSGGSLSKKDARGATALWTRTKGFIVRGPGVGNVETLYTAAMSLFMGQATPMLRGERDVPESTLREAYSKAQLLLQHTNASADQKKTARMMVDLLLRLRYWRKARESFARERTGQLQPAYDSLGLKQPAWASITRAALNEHVKTLRAAFEARADVPDAHKQIEELVIKGLWKLDPSVIKTEWL